MKTARVAALLGTRQQEGALALPTGCLDRIDALEDEVQGTKRQMEAEKQAAGKKRSVREDLELRAKVGTPWCVKLTCPAADRALHCTWCAVGTLLGPCPSMLLACRM